MSSSESKAKKAATLAKYEADAAKLLTTNRQKRKQSRKQAFANARKYEKEYATKNKQEARLVRQARDLGNFYVPETARLMCVIRIRGINDMHPKSRKILQLLRLRQINNLVFIKLTKATMNMVRKVEPYVAYGYPPLKTVRELIYKRGHGKVAKQRVPLTDNSIIEKALGQYGIICMEDLIHEIYTTGDRFKEAANFLWPMKLSNLRGGMTDKGTHFVEGGESGNREQYINSMITRMNGSVSGSSGSAVWNEIHDHIPEVEQPAKKQKTADAPKPKPKPAKATTLTRPEKKQPVKNNTYDRAKIEPVMELHPEHVAAMAPRSEAQKEKDQEAAHKGEMGERLKAAGAQVGALTVSLMWHNKNDLDLHCESATGSHIFYGKRTGTCTGLLDVDANAKKKECTLLPIENILWHNPPKGHYRFWVEAVDMDRSDGATPFSVRMTKNGKSTDKDFADIEEDDELNIFEFDL